MLIPYRLAFSVRTIHINPLHVVSLSQPIKDDEGGDPYLIISLTNGKEYKLLDDEINAKKLTRI